MNIMLRVAVVFSLLLTGCGNDMFEGDDLDKDSRLNKHVIYYPSHPWIGKCAQFESLMVYMTNLPSKAYNDEVIRIGWALSRTDDADYLRMHPDFKNMVITPVPPGTTFQVTAVFKNVHGGFSRFFNDDFDMPVLMDSHGQISTGNLSESELKPCN